MAKVGVAGNSAPSRTPITSHFISFKKNIFTESFTKLERTTRLIKFDRL